MKLNASLFIILILIAVTSCVHTQSELKTPALVQVEGALHFYVFGDWGRKGEPDQKAVAVMMNKAGEVVEPEFIVSTGDNFYPNGVMSTIDPQWKYSYEDVYDGFYLNCPWYVALGNHDYRSNAQAEIEYSKISARWRMPDRYYTFITEEDENLKVRFIFIDTTPYELEYYKDETYKDKVAGQDTTRQKVWMDSVMAIDDADWKIVVGHHPMYTGGKRRDDVNTVRKSIEPFLKKHNIDAYFSGHEHDLQHIKPEGVTHHFISGAGSEIRSTGMLPISLFAESIQGFMVVSVTKTALLIQVVNRWGDILYTTEVKK